MCCVGTLSRDHEAISRWWLICTIGKELEALELHEGKEGQMTGEHSTETLEETEEFGELA